jgi:hypothetical protein
MEWHGPIYEALLVGDAAAARAATEKDYASALKNDIRVLDRPANTSGMKHAD